ncbi:testis-expressed protein 49 isoform X2 [Rhinatrema bivittatum]|uniref:testis-expressed protein 49 isoform X2 n=1 Tax=Rhinatrema bivittatum TaxID=194408 RepID=UPI00112640A2|nr:testis-expressed protein 49 isoform X2 [Rhinatrema bivittatum]
MAFFSLTSVGHQDPFIGRKLQPATVESSEEELERKEELDPGKLPPISPAADTADSYPHQGSQETNKEMMKRDQQMKSVRLVDVQVLQNPRERTLDAQPPIPKDLEPNEQVRR